MRRVLTMMTRHRFSADRACPTWMGWPSAFRAPGRTGGGLDVRRRLGAWLGALMLVPLLSLPGCVEAPTMTSPAELDDPLAETFDALARAAGEYGDLARSDGFAFAALSVRSGITPSRLEVQSGAVREAYDAFVSAVWWDSAVPAGVRPPARRSLVGWRKTAEGTTRIIALTVPSDSARIVSPLALGAGGSTVAVYAGASAMQNEGRDTPQGRPDVGAAWYGTAGWVKLAEVARLGACIDSARHANVLGVAQCEQVRYQVAFDLTMQKLTGRPPQVAADAVTRRVTTPAETVVGGLRLRFACTAPNGWSGCK